ncbi:MAG TPA: hypothetical protein EYG69_04555 [Campylobacterales bacterium]|nr:hypothetical protein [Campylobacterales bacterium]
MKKNNSVIKLTLFLLFFMIVLTLFLLIYIIPELKKYKTNKIVLNKYEKLYNKEKRTLNSYIKNGENIQIKYKKEILKFNNKFNEEDFINFIKKYLQNVTIERNKEDSKNTTYKIEGNIDKLNYLYNFIDKLNTYKNFVKINFPLVYKVEKKSILLKINVTILH